MALDFSIFDTPSDPAPAAGPSEFSKGLKSGALGMESQLKSFAGGIGGALGYDQFAAERNAAAQRTALEAQAAAPRVTSYKEGFGSLRDFGDYAAGLAGQAVPSIGLGVGAGALVAATGGGAIPALAAGAASQFPFEAGDVLQRQQQDPNAKLRGAGENLRDAMLAGGASAIGQAVVPAALGGRLVGKAVQGIERGALKEGIKSGATGIGKSALRDALQEGASEGAGEIVKQQGVTPGAPIDWNQAAENAVGGALVGTGMGGIGGVADGFHENKNAAVDAVKSVAEKGTAAVKSAAEKAREAAAPGQTEVDQGVELGQSPTREMMDAAVKKGAEYLDTFKRAMTPKDKTADAVETGSPIAGLSPDEQAEVAEPSTPKERLTQLLDKGTEAVKGWSQKAAAALSERADLAPDIRERAAKVAAGAGEAADAAWVATQDKVVKAKDAVKSKVDDITEQLAKIKDSAPLGKVRDTLSLKKKSEDFTGVRETIANDLAPLMPADADPETVQKLAEGVRNFMDVASRPNNSVALETAAEGIRQVLGGDADAVDSALINVYMKTVQEDPRAVQQFAANLSGTRKAGESNRRLLSTVTGALPDEFKGNAQEIMDGLVSWASGEGDVQVGGSVGKVTNDAVRAEIKKAFGPKTDQVLDAVQKHLEERSVRAAVGFKPDMGTGALESDTIEGGNPKEAPPEDTQQLFANQYKDKAKREPIPMQNPTIQNARAPEGKVGSTQKLLDKLKAQFPNSEVKWVSEFEETGSGSKDHGFVKVTDAPKEGELTVKDWTAARLDQDKAAKSPSRIEVPLGDKDASVYGATGDKLILDAVKMARAGMKALQKTTGSDGQSDSVRLARGFMEAVAQATDQFGVAPAIKGSTVIGYIGNQPFTAAMAKKIDVRTDRDVKTDSSRKDFQAQVDKLREAYKSEKDPDQKENIRARARELIDSQQAEHAAGVLAGDREGAPTSLAEELLTSTGKYELAADANVHEAALVNGDKMAVQGERSELRAKPANAKPWRFAAAELEDVSPAGKTAANRINALASNINAMSEKDRNAMTAVLTGEPAVSEVAPIVNRLFEKYKAVLKTPAVQSDGNALAPEARERQKVKEAEGSPDPKARAAQEAALNQAASSSDPALLNELKTTDNAAGLQRTAAFLAENHADSEAARVAGERFDELVQDPDVAYSLQTANPTTGPVNRQPAMEYLKKVLGNSVAVEWKNIPHAGEFDRDIMGDVIRLSVHALNPKSVAYHESLHAFFAQLRDQGNGKIASLLEKAASQPHVQQQLKAFFKNEPAVLRQINTDREEAAAYMYQLWAQGDLKLNPQATTFFQKVANFMRSVLGIWSNDQRALHIMEYFNSGEYAKTLGKPDVVALLTPGTNRAVEQAKSLLQPAAKLSDAVFAAGSSRLRDSGVAALIELADTIKPRLTEGKTVGFLEAAREERATRMNALAESLGSPSKDAMADAVEALQIGQPAKTAEGARIQGEVLKFLRGMKSDYLDPHIKIGDLGPDYFPRVWDPSVLSTKQNEFLAMMDKYVASGQYSGDPRVLLSRLMANDGNDFAVDTRVPGFQSGKERGLTFIEGADAQPFLSKDLYQTMNGYVAQSARRVEFAKRFGEDGRGLDALLARAKREGATDEQLKTAETYIKGVTGTLGDGIDPRARRLMGNVLVYQNLRLLPLAIFSSIVDPLGIAVRGGTMREAFDAFKRGVREIPQSFRNQGQKDWQTELAETLGVVDNTSMLHAVGALYSQGMVGDVGRKVNDALFRFNLMEQYNRSMRVAATETATRFIQRHGGNVDSNSARFLEELGLTGRDVRTDPATGRLRVTEADGLSEQQALKMRVAINKWVDGAVLRPDSADRPIFYNDPHFVLISHLKSFVYAFHHTIIDRVVHEAQQGNYKPLAVMGSYVPVMIGADMMKGMIQGGGSEPAWKRDWGPAEYIWSGVQRGGLLGVGQFGADVLNDIERGGVGAGALVGPTIEQLIDGVQVAGGTERFSNFALKSMPANALYGSLIKGGSVPKEYVAD